MRRIIYIIIARSHACGNLYTLTKIRDLAMLERHDWRVGTGLLLNRRGRASILPPAIIIRLFATLIINFCALIIKTPL